MCYLLKKYFWWLLRRVKNLWSTACKHYRESDVIYRYLHIKLIWCLLMVQYLQNNVIMKWTTRFIRFTGWIPLKYGSTTTPPIIAHCQKTDVKPRISHCDPQNLQYKTHPEFWPSHRRIFKTSLYYKTRLILETGRYFYISVKKDSQWGPCWHIYWQLKPSLKLLDCGRKIQNYVHIDTYYCKPELMLHDDKST